MFDGSEFDALAEAAPGLVPAATGSGLAVIGTLVIRFIAPVGTETFRWAPVIAAAAAAVIGGLATKSWTAPLSAGLTGGGIMAAEETLKYQARRLVPVGG